MTHTDNTPANMIGRTQAALETIRRTHHCLIVAVTGSIACGKSTVSGMLEDLGAPLIDLDRIAREVVMPGTSGYEQIISAFGAGVLQPDGALDRKILSGIVFADETKRSVLERITHPLIFDRFVENLTQLSKVLPDSVIQAAVPLLIEMNIQHLFDRVIVVYLPEEIQLKRLSARDNISVDKAATIISSQLSAHEKKPYAHYVIDNSQDRSHTREQVTQVWQRLQQDKKQLYPDTDAH
jgi:dephospho-CoA kinase